VVVGVDAEAVSAWIVGHVDGVRAPLRFELIAGGRSNLTYTVTDADGRRLVLRRPPLGHVLATAHDMAREHRIISALGTTSVPVPPALGLCTDVDVNGAPFYVMGFVDGVVLDSPANAALLPMPLRRTVSENLIDELADLHAVDVDAVGLGDLARRDGYIERQIKRWSTQWERSKTRELPAVETVADILRRRIPTQHGVAVVHGDYRFGNCLVDPMTGRIVAILDWELCTLGDALADLGYLAVYWSDPGATGGRNNDPTGAGGFCAFADLVERYASRSGRDVADVEYHRAFSSWRVAVICEGVYARYLHGAMGDQGLDEHDLAELRDRTEVLAEVALAAAGTLA